MFTMISIVTNSHWIWIFIEQLRINRWGVCHSYSSNNNKKLEERRSPCLGSEHLEAIRSLCGICLTWIGIECYCVLPDSLWFRIIPVSNVLPNWSQCMFFTDVPAFIHMGQVTELWLSCYLVLLSIDSKTIFVNVNWEVGIIKVLNSSWEIIHKVGTLLHVFVVI